MGAGHQHAVVAHNAERSARGRQIRRVALVSGLVNFLLALAQVLVGLIANSAALVADGVHSASDLLSDVLVWFAARHASQAPDDDHPYGHGRFETAATLGLGILLSLAALGIVWNGVERLLDNARPTPETIALWVALIGIAAKESLYWYTIVAARRVNSEMLRANAWHHRSDAISSLVVLIGVAGAILGFSYMDALAAIVVGLMVLKIGWDLGRAALSELVDTALDEQQVEAVQRQIETIDGVRSVHMLRTRRHGPEASLDVHVQVAPRLSVSEGHMIGQAVEDQLKQRFDFITDVTVHIDPEDDEHVPRCSGLPLRAEAEQALLRHWQAVDGFVPPREIRLHYLRGKIDVELVLPLASHVDQTSTEDLRGALRAAAASIPWFNGLRILFT